MKHLIGLIGVAVEFAWVAVVGSKPVYADGPVGCVFVSETSHNIHGVFRAFYDAHNGWINFGPPLTEALRERGRIVQYFLRARLEFYPENPESFRVQVGLLGLEYNVTDPPLLPSARPSSGDPNFLYFPNTGLAIGFAIKDYWVAQGGVEILGFPISRLRFESGKFVQYFQRARLEWDPSDAGPNKVRASSVGQFVLDKHYAPSSAWRARAANDWCTVFDPSKPVAPSNPIKPTSVLTSTLPTVEVYVKFRQTGLVGPQYVDVLVYDRNNVNKPIAGAALEATVRSFSGERVFPLMSTDESGRSWFSFEIGRQPAGSTTQVEVKAYMGPSVWVGNSRFTHSR